MTNQIPLIWTSKGNVPLDSLTCQTEWDIKPTYYKFIERYLDASGEVVKLSAHVYSTMGVAGQGDVNSM